MVLVKFKIHGQKRIRDDAITQMHPPPATTAHPQLFNINIEVKKQEKGPELMSPSHSPP